jgi:hydroxyacyl-ACP dehydratase HTD2-like protein with hotdog domain
MINGKNIIKPLKIKIIFKKKIKLKDIIAFSKLVDDKHKLHKDKKFSLKKNFKNIVCQGLFLSSICSSVVFKYFKNNAIIMRENFIYLKPIYVNEIIYINSNIRLLDKRFSIYEIKIFIKANKSVKTKGKIIVKII